MHHQPNLRAGFTIVTLFVIAAICAACQTRDPANRANNDRPPDGPTPPAEQSTPTPTPSGSPTATPKTEPQNRRVGSAKEDADNAWLQRRGIIPLVATASDLLNKDRVNVNARGRALLDFGECGRLTLFTELDGGQLRASPCSKAQVLSGTCVNKGSVNFDVGNHRCAKRIMPSTDGVEVNLPSDISRAETFQVSETGLFAHSRFIDLRANRPANNNKQNYVTVYYFPKQALSVVQVRDGSVIAYPVVKEATKRTRRKLGAPITLNQHELMITKPGVAAGPNINVGSNAVPQRVALSSENLIDPLIETLSINENPLSANDPQPVTPGTSTQIAMGDGASTTRSETRAIMQPSPNPLDFETEVVGDSKIRFLTLNNLGGVPMVISQPTTTASSEFIVSETAKCTTNPTDRCELVIIFKPTAVGPRSAELSIPYNGENSPGKISLVGIGTAPTVLPPIRLQMNLAAGATSFPIQKVGTTTTQKVFIENTGEVAVTIDNVSIAGSGKGAFVTANQCKGPLAPKASCVVDVTFNPQAPDGYSASLSVRATEVAPLTGMTARTVDTTPVEVKGIGGLPIISASVTELCFDKHKVVKDSEPKVRKELTVTVSNLGPVPLTISEIKLSNDDFQVVRETCKTKDVASGQCTVVVGFTPRKSGLREGSLNLVSDDAKASPTNIALRGAGKSRNPIVRFFKSIFNRPKNPCK